MKISTLKQVEELLVERSKLLTDMGHATSTGASRLGITFHGRYQNDSFVDVIRPAVVAELQRQIDYIHKALEALGMEIDS